MQKRALIVDEELATCELLQKVLNSVGIESLSVANSAEAAEIFQQVKFAVAFLEYKTAGQDGPELTRQMRLSDYNPMTPIVLISDDQRPNAMTKGFAAGASFFLYKPLDKDRVLRLVRATQGAIDNNLRRTRRVPLKSKVQVRFRGQEIEGVALNISMQGLLVQVPKVFPVGSSVEVSLHLSKAVTPIRGAGSVVRVQGPDQMGIHLGRLPFAESERLQEFLLPLIPIS